VAIGILMAKHKVTGEGTITLLRTASQHLQRKLREVAADVVDTGTLPDLRRSAAQRPLSRTVRVVLPRRPTTGASHGHRSPVAT
jgi:hypothetical protein